MFYDLDILNRRGGKFGIIWLAAHKKLRLKGRSADFQMMMKVNVSRICEDIQRYVKVMVPPEAPGKESPRFSLYLAAMLTHGAILVHHEQVKHDVSNIETIFTNKAADQLNQKKISITRKEGKHPNAQVVAQEALTTEIDFGNLGAGFINDEAVGFRMVAESPRRLNAMDQDNQPAHPRDVLLTADVIGDDFTELDASFSGAMTLPHITTMDKITLKEIDPLPRLGDLAEINPNDENLAIIMPDDGFPLEPLPLPILVDEADVSDQVIEGRDQSGKPMRGTPSKKRGRSSSPDATPSKRRPGQYEEPNAVSTPVQQPGDVVSDQPVTVDNRPIRDVNAVPPEMVLEPVQEQPRRQNRRRRPRRHVDQHISISSENFIAQKNNFHETLRVQEHVDDHIVILPDNCLAQDMFNQPSRKIVCLPLRELSTRHMKVRAVMDYSTPSPPPAKAQTPSVPVAQVDEVSDGIVPLPIHSNVLFEGDAMAINDVPLDVPTDETVPEQEELRLNSMQSRDPSLAMSALGTSRMDLSSSDGSRLVAQPTPEKLPALATLKEASMEVSRATVDPRISSVDPSAVLPMPSLQVPIIDFPLQDASPLREGSRRPSPLLGAERLNLPYRRDLPPIPSSHSSTQELMPDGSELVQLIQERIESEGMDRISFRVLCPPADNSRTRAAKLFGNLLWLKKGRHIELYQNVAYGEIYIELTYD